MNIKLANQEDLNLQGKFNSTQPTTYLPVMQDLYFSYNIALNIPFVSSHNEQLHYCQALISDVSGGSPFTSSDLENELNNYYNNWNSFQGNVDMFNDIISNITDGAKTNYHIITKQFVTALNTIGNEFNSDGYYAISIINNETKTFDSVNNYANLKYKRAYGNNGSVTISNMLPGYVYIATGNSSGNNYAEVNSLRISSLSIPYGYGSAPNNSYTGWMDLNMPFDDQYVPMYCVAFECEYQTLPSITLPNNVHWVGGAMPNVELGTISGGILYEIVIQNNMAQLITTTSI